MKNWIAPVIFIGLLLTTSFLCRRSAQLAEELVSIDNKGWRLTSLASAQEKIIVPDSANVTLYFRDGLAKGNLGCNTYNGKFKLDGKELDCLHLVNSYDDCAPISPVQNQYLNILQFASEYAATPESLQIDCGDRGGLSFVKINL